MGYTTSAVVAEAVRIFTHSKRGLSAPEDTLVGENKEDGEQTATGVSVRAILAVEVFKGDRR